MENEITKKMYLLAKEIVKMYESKEKPKTIRKRSEINLDINFSDVLKENVFKQWLNYRKEIKKPVNVRSTLERLFSRFEKESLEKCKFVVNQSIENKYTGLFWENYKGEVSNSKKHISASEKLKQELFKNL